MQLTSSETTSETRVFIVITVRMTHLSLFPVKICLCALTEFIEIPEILTPHDLNSTGNFCVLMLTHHTFVKRTIGLAPALLRLYKGEVKRDIRFFYYFFNAMRERTADKDICC